MKKNKYKTIILPCGRKTIIDNKYLFLVDVFPWWRWAGEYTKISRSIKTKYGVVKQDIYLHRLIVFLERKGKPWGGMQIDHKNRQKLDNRVCNLRLCTHSQNMKNATKMKNKKSKYKGVSRASHNEELWRAFIKIGKKQKHLGLFKSEKEAAQAYDNEAKIAHGVFANLNFQESSEEESGIKLN